MNELELNNFRIARLQAAVDKLTGGNKSEFGRRLGYKDGAFVRQMLSGDRAVTEKTIRSVEAMAGMAGWFAEPNSAPAEAPKKGTIRALFEESTASASDNNAGTQKFDKNVSPAQLGQRLIPVISYVQAGMMTEVVDPFSLGMGFETIQPTVACSEFSFGLTIEGDSMEPRFHEGDVVIIDPLREPRPGNFVVAKNGKEEATFKKYRPRATDERGNIVFELVPLNDDYPTLHSERDHLQVIGVCVELRQKMV
jgi:SOS-response transcriptional repressor LexA